VKAHKIGKLGKMRLNKPFQAKPQRGMLKSLWLLTLTTGRVVFGRYRLCRVAALRLILSLLGCDQFKNV
jgi:hypothetical protein